MIDYEVDTTPQGEEREKTLERLMGLVDEQLTIEATIEIAEETLKELKKDHNRVALLEIPEIMDELGVAEITLTNGKKVSVKENLYCSVPKKRMGEIADFLIDHDYATLLKQDVIVPLDATDDELKANVLDALARVGVDYSETFKVNTSSLKKAVKEMLENGVDLDLSMFGAFIKKETKIK